MTLEEIDIVRRFVAANPATFELATTAADIRRIEKAGRIASLIGVEGGHQIDGRLSVLRQYRALGVAYMTLTHGKSLNWADSSTDAPRANGLSDFGRQVVARDEPDRHDRRRVACLRRDDGRGAGRDQGAGDRLALQRAGDRRCAAQYPRRPASRRSARTAAW